MQREGKIAVWEDARIAPGEEWEPAILDALDSADLVLPLLTVPFLASEFIYSTELQRALDRHNAGECLVVPIIVRPCDWLNSPVAHLQSLPARGKSVWSYSHRDEAWTEVVVALRKLLAKQPEGHKEPGSLSPPALSPAPDRKRQPWLPCRKWRNPIYPIVV